MRGLLQPSRGWPLLSVALRRAGYALAGRAHALKRRDAKNPLYHELEGAPRGLTEKHGRTLSGIK